MTMTIETNHQQRFPLSFDHMSSYQNQPQFTNPWVSPSSAAPPQAGSHDMYMGNQGGLPSDPLSLDSLKHHGQHQQHQQQLPPLSQPHHQQPVSRAMSTSSTASMASYSSLPAVTTSSTGSPLNTSMADTTSTTSAGMYAGQQNLLSMSQDLLSLGRLAVHQAASTAGYADPAYTTAASPIHSTYAAASPTPYDQLGYAPAPMRSTFAAMAPEQDTRRYSQGGLQSDDRRSFADAIEASHGILSLSQETPRPIYGSRTRGSGDSYGFPSTHSTSSSVSSTGFSGYYGGSVDSSVSDYSTAGSDIESVTASSMSSRALPRPQGLALNQTPPAPQSMMGQFSSKVASNTQKKHKCKVCDKRFTRPSSLQTHMYSHTGEKPFSCDVEGCGRHFSVVSNLRRHRKVHKGQAPSEAGSEDHHSD